MTTDLNYFTKKSILFISPVLISILSLTIYFTFFSNNNFQYEFLFLHQKNKIEKSHHIDSVFIGDSSLGNAIDAKYFSDLSSKKTINLALTGKFGYAGSYNMLKRAFRQNPEIKNAYIMQTVDMYLRPISYTGYLLTAETIKDYTELNIIEFLKLIKAGLSLSKNVKYKIKDLFKNELNESSTDQKSMISDDYIKQGPAVDFSKDTEFLKIKKISGDRFIFLEKIKDFAKTNHINLIYLHGPYLQKRLKKSESYIEFINQKIKDLDILLIDQLLGIKNGENGDTEDHIRPDLKKQYTKNYWELINRAVQDK